MSVAAAQAETLVLAALPAQAWKNGAGRTRELAVEPVGAGFEDFGWRISVAELARDAPFSAFPGVERCIVLLDGPGLHLRAADGSFEHRLDQPHRPFCFAGELAVDARLLGGPGRDLNVMTRRGRWRSELQVFAEAGRLDAGADAVLLLATAGRWSVDGPAPASGTLQAGEARLWRHAPGPLRLQPQDGTARALAVQLWRLP